MHDMYCASANTIPIKKTSEVQMVAVREGNVQLLRCLVYIFLRIFRSKIGLRKGPEFSHDHLNRLHNRSHDFIIE